MKRRLSLIAALLLLPAPARAASLPPAPTPAAQQLTQAARISVLTVSPGDMLHTLFGHSALRVVDSTRHFDLVFNYGTFDFGPDFLPRFVYGQLDYFLSVSTYQQALDMWRAEQRSVSEQQLLLDAAQREQLFAFLIDNARPENRIYRYDFLLDNCSTRVADALASVLGSRLVWAPEPGRPRSFRAMLDPYLVARPLLHFGIDVLMGVPVDRLTTAREAMFLPDELARALAAARLHPAEGELPGRAAPDSASRPLAGESTLLYDAGRPLMPSPVPDWGSILGWILFALGIAPGRPRWRRFYDGALFLLVGLVGLLAALLWGVTLHHVTDDNLNLLWAWPTHAWVGMVIWLGRTPRWVDRYLLLTAGLTLACVLAWPWLPQRLPTAGLPLSLALIAASLHRWRRTPSTSPPPAGGRHDQGNRSA